MNRADAGYRTGLPPHPRAYQELPYGLPPYGPPGSQGERLLEEYAVAARGLTKVFPGQGRRGAPHTAVDGLDLTVEAGTVVGVLGRNGAGKTTMMDMLTGMTRPTRGTVTLFGLPPQDMAAKRLIGVVGQANLPWKQLSGRQNLLTQARIDGCTRREARRRAEAALDLADLRDAAGRPAGKYSTGMARRLQIWQNLLRGPKILFLDEPTLGVDPRQADDLYERIEELRDAGTAVVLTTNTLAEAARLCDRIAVINNGRVVAEDSPGALQRRYGHVDITVRVAAGPWAQEKARAAAAAVPGVRAAASRAAGPGEAQLLITADADDATTALVLKTLIRDEDLDIRDVVTSPPTLDEVFRELTGPSPVLR